ncbi:MAG: AAA family ATPase [Nitrospinaceae bacterium]
MIGSVQQRDFYHVLGIRSDATQPEIDHAYQRLIGRLDSPRVQSSPRIQDLLNEKIALLQEAYDTLSNREKRDAHDRGILSQKQKKPTPARFLHIQMPPGLAEEIRAGIQKKPHDIYRDYFGFSEKPFDLTPDPKYLYLSPKHKEVLAHLIYGLQDNNGFLKIIGEVGTGKTMICRSFLRELHSDFNIAYIFNPGIDELELLQTINAELGLPSESPSKKKLTDILNRFLLEERKKGNRVVVIIDEAQDLLPGVLEQLRLLSNLETETEKLIQIVLIGQPELNKLLSHEDLRQLNQRITIQWELLPLNQEETRGYIQHRLNVALGRGKVLFTRAAADWIYRYSKGIPRMINVIADRTLMIGYTRNTRKITGTIVRQAVKDIGGLRRATNWKDLLWKIGLPAGAVFALLIFIFIDFTQPNSRANADRGRDIPDLIQANPIDLAAPGRLIEKQTMTPASLAPPIPEENPAAVEETPVTPRRKINGPVPLSVSKPEKLVTYLSSLSLKESKIEAAKWILKSWGFDPIEIQGIDEWALNNLQEEFDLAQFELSGNFKRLTTLNYPALLEMNLPYAQGTKYLALISIHGDRGVFGSVDQIEMPLKTINPLWTRKAIIFWKDFEMLPEKLGRGFNGKEAIWLQKNLRLLGYFQGLEAPYFGERTERAVLQFQRKNNIKDDGRFSSNSKMLLYNILNIYPTPKLVEP